MRIFLAGGTGFVGRHLRSALLERGHQLVLLTHRQGIDPEPGIEQTEGDVTRSESYAAALQECDAVINVVGIIREYPGEGVIFERLHGEATRTLLAAARKGGVKRFLQMSALGARPAAVSRYHQTKYRAEEEVRQSGLEWTIFRPAIIFGPRDDFINRLARLVVKLPVVPVIGDGSYRLQPIHADDVARCFATALEMPETIGKTFELCGMDRFSYLELLDGIGRVLGRRTVRKIRLPLGLMEALIPHLQRFPFFPITMDQFLMLLEESVCDGTWRETFRFEPVGLEEGIRAYLG